jgi:uncharacterized delta-60 repeat protein
MNIKNIIIVIAFNFVSLSIFAGADQFNTAFGGTGYASMGGIWPGYQVFAAIAQPLDEKLIVVGYGQPTGAPKPEIAIARFLTNGKLDTIANGGSGFGSSTPSSALGYTLLTIDPSIAATTQSQAYAVALDAAGNIVVTGFAQNSVAATSWSQNNLIIARFTPQGVPDTTFGVQGATGITGTMPTTANFTGYVGTVAGTTGGSLGYITLLLNNELIGYGMAIQPDGKIVIAGFTNTNIMIILRFLSTGALDMTANGGSGFGNATPSLATGYNCPNIAFRTFATTILANGKILVAGQSYTDNGQMVLMRFTSAGVLDTTFAYPNGYITTTVASRAESAAKVLLVQPDGTIDIAGFTRNTDGKYAALSARFSADGIPDLTYGSPNGYVITIIPNNTVTTISGIAYDPHGKLLLTGYIQNSSGTHTIVIRYNLDGSLDTTFSSTGYIVIDMNGIPQTGAASIAIRSDGTLILGASIYGSNGGLGAISFLGGGLPINETSSIATYGQSQNLFQEFLYVNFYAQGITDLTARAATIAAINQIFANYATLYSNQHTVDPTFNYLSYIYLNTAEMNIVQATLLTAYPESIDQINSFFRFIYKRIITLTVQQN